MLQMNLDIFKVGDLVLVKMHVRDKLVMKWSPPQYQVISLPKQAYIDIRMYTHWKTFEDLSQTC